MRHQVKGRHLGRTSSHRIALRRNLAASLIEHGTISTTREKAKFVKPFVEKLITLAKDPSLHARRRTIALLGDRNIAKVEDGQPETVGRVVRKLFSEIAPRFADRNGGYTRIIKLPLRRVGDNSQLVLLQLLEQQAPAPSPSAPTQPDDAARSEAQPEQPAAGEPVTPTEPGAAVPLDTAADPTTDENADRKADT